MFCVVFLFISFFNKSREDGGGCKKWHSLPSSLVVPRMGGASEREREREKSGGLRGRRGGGKAQRDNTTEEKFVLPLPPSRQQPAPRLLRLRSS